MPTTIFKQNQKTILYQLSKARKVCQCTQVPILTKNLDKQPYFIHANESELTIPHSC